MLLPDNHLRSDVGAKAMKTSDGHCLSAMGCLRKPRAKAQNSSFSFAVAPFWVMYQQIVAEVSHSASRDALSGGGA